MLLGGREEKLATECVYLVKRSMYGAAWLVQQWLVQQWSVQQRLGSRGWCDEWCAVWCSSSAAVVGVMGGVLYGAAVVQQWLAQQCVRSNNWSSSSGCYLCVRWCVEPCVAQCRYARPRVVLSRDTQSDACGIKRDGVRR